MKLLLVFVSALVLVAHGNVIPSDGNESVYEFNHEEVADYAEQAAGGVEPQGVFTEKVPVVHVFSAKDEPRVCSPQEPKGEEPAAESVPVPETGVSIPIASRACINAACINVCHRLGYRYGICISPSSCLCSK